MINRIVSMPVVVPTPQAAQTAQVRRREDPRMTTAAPLNPHLDLPAVPAPDLGARGFHEALPGYAPTPVHRLSELARELGVATVGVKDESQRLGLPAFKILGASWAVE